MKHPFVNGPFSHDLMAVVMRELYPALTIGVHYTCAHEIDPETGEHGDPILLYWRVPETPEPDAADIKKEFEANEAKYRALYARAVRDTALESSDAKVAVLPDAGEAQRPKHNVWITYRQALRDVPQQPGFPLDIDWPEYPG